MKTPLTLAFVLLALLPAQEPGMPKYDEEKLPYRGQWAGYTVVVEKEGTEEFSPHRVRLLDAGGKVVRQIEDQRFPAVRLRDLTGDGKPELYVHAFSGGAHCCTIEYFFSPEEGARNLLTYIGGNSETSAVKDLSGDGRPEVIAGVDALAYFGGLSYADSPGMVMIIGWDGRRYVNQTARFPDRSRNLARQYRDDFLKALKKQGEQAEVDRRSGALGYWANSLFIGEGAAAREWLLQRAPASTRRWLLRQEKDLHAAVLSADSRLTTSQEPVLKPNLFGYP